MPLIPYPDVPLVTGVPPLPVPPVGFDFPLQDVNLDSLESDSPAAVDVVPQWQITDSNGAELLTPDSVIDFEYRNENKISNYPVEEGSFASYNKIATPFDARVTLACNGNGGMTREQFLGTVKALLDSLTLITIVTPDATYQNCNLVHFDYRRESRQGISLVVAQLWFQEVRTVSAGTTSTAQPDGADAKANGQVSPVDPTTKQTAAAAQAIQ
jgi:hypothetical protein